MIEKIENNQIPDFIEKSTSKHPNPADALPDDKDVSVQVNYASLIDQAMQIPQTDVNKVEQARELLSSGRLESPDNFRRAAEYMVIFGI